MLDGEIKSVERANLLDLLLGRVRENNIIQNINDPEKITSNNVLTLCNDAFVNSNSKLNNILIKYGDYYLWLTKDSLMYLDFYNNPGEKTLKVIEVFEEVSSEEFKDLYYGKMRGLCKNGSTIDNMMTK